MADTNRRILLASRPKGRPTHDNFRFEDAAIPTPGEGEVLLQILYLSLDPYMRGRMNDAKSYAAPVADRRRHGRRHRRSRSSASRHPDFAEGDIVLSHSGWQTHAVADGHEPAQARSRRCARLDGARRARHARLHGLCRPADHRPAEAGRDGRGRGGERRGRLGRRADRPDQGRARRRHRRRGRRNAPSCATNSASTPWSITARPTLPNSSRRPARKASTSISRMSAARSGMRSSRCSTPSPAFRSAG